MIAGGITLVGWMVHAVVVALLLAGAAWLLDRALVRARLPGRWIWLGALWLSIGIPAAGFVAGGLGPTMAELPGIQDDAGGFVEFGDADTAPRPHIGTLLVSAVSIAGGWVSATVRWGASSVAAPTRPILYLWATSSMLLTAVLVLSCATVARRRRRWPHMDLHGRSVRVAPEMGPAVSGVLRPEIVVPRWCLSLAKPDLELVLSHEEAHLEARDSLLMAAALIPVFLLPWNPIVWWQLRRLRDAVEVDCDRRVLRQTAAASYGRVLLRLGHRTHADVAPALSLSGSPSLLERRLNAMKKRSLKTVLPLGVLGTAAGILLVAVACDVDLPVQSVPDGEATFDRATSSDEESGDQAASPDDESGDRVIRARTQLPDGVVYIVDGAVVSDLSSLSPDEIESIQVFKGEAARERYGEEGRNGAILVQTKEESADQSSAESGTLMELLDGRLEVRGTARGDRMEVLDGRGEVRARVRADRIELRGEPNTPDPTEASQ